MKRVGVFIDGSNVFWGCKREGWKIDYAGLKQYFEEKYNPVFCRYYGVIDNSPHIIKSNRKPGAQAKFYRFLEALGYMVILKPLKYIEGKDKSYTTKGDMDIDLSIGIFNTYENLDHIVLVSGDSDYLAALKYFYEQGKTVSVYSCNSTMAWELKTFTMESIGCSYTLFNTIRSEVELTSQD